MERIKDKQEFESIEMTATKRTFTNIENGHNCRLYTSKDNSVYHLIYEGQPNEISDGTEVNGFYLLAHTPGQIKINNKKVIKLNRGSFYDLKEGEKVTHIKYCGFNNFTKIK